MRKPTLFNRAALLLAMALILVGLPPLCPPARATGEIVRVGWFESLFNTTDALGRRSGYAYEYEQKLAAYTGWTYEYVQGSWPELMQMLADGRIDLLADVSYTDARAAQMLYSALPMGAESYCLIAALNNAAITPEDYTTLEGRRVGVNRGSVQADMFRDWENANGVRAELVELSGTEDEHLKQLSRGIIDAYVTLDAFCDPTRAQPICEIGASDFFFAVNTARPELLTELNSAMRRVLDENPYFNQTLHARYIQTTGTNLFLTAGERAWLDAHGTIRVGYQDNYLAFCASDPKTGELTGALKDYLAFAADSLGNASLTFEATAYPTASEALKALKRGELDCVFPANLTDYDGETQGFFMTPALMRTDMSAVVREAEQKSFNRDGHITVAVNAGNTNYDMFLLNYFPDWRSIYFKDTPACLEAIAEGKADCLLISNFRFNNISALCEQYDLTTVSTGVAMDYCFAVNRDSLTLYSILSKVTSLVPAATVNSALSYYFTEDAKSTLGQLLRQNMLTVGALLAALMLAFAALAVGLIRANARVKAGQRLVALTERDPLTGLYNRDYFLAYANRRYLEQPNLPMDAIAVNIDRFRDINAANGRAFGDRALRALADDVRAWLKEHDGIAGRSGADGLLIYCARVEDPYWLLNRMQGVMDTLTYSLDIRLRMGVCPAREGVEPADAFKRALTACDTVRENRIERIAVFDDALRARLIGEQSLLNDLRPALENGAFEVFYQPKYDITAEAPTLTGAEALVRWRHPERGLLIPEDFVPLLERNGQIAALNRFVWREAARQAAEWREKYGFALPVSVSLSRTDLFDMRLEGVFEGLMAEYGLNPGEMWLEVPESACAERGWQVSGALEGLRKRGLRLELDGFGAGSASMSMLSDIPVHALKLGPAFVANIEFDDKALRLVELILSVAARLDIPVIAVGVENEAQVKLLRERGCTRAQGYYFAKPLPPAEFEAQILLQLSVHDKLEFDENRN